jgi:hypothetical protein
MDLAKYHGLLPIVKVEMNNIEYVYSQIAGKTFENDKFEKLIFKEGQMP